MKAFSIVLQAPLSSNHNDADLKELLGLIPKQAPDQAAFAAEFEVFVNVVYMTEENTETGATIMSMADAEAEKRKQLFPLTNRIYRLALTAPITVATNERTFTKCKIVKTALRNSTSDDCLFNLILLNCEKDITDAIDLDCLVDKWSIKTKRHIDL